MRSLPARSPESSVVVQQVSLSPNASRSRAERIGLGCICLAACVLLLVAAIRFYFGPEFAATFNSDAAVPVLLANEVLRTGRLLPATWYFGNNEIWTLSPHIFAIPFVAVFGVSTLALKLANLLCLGIMIIFMALPLHRITRSWPYSVLVATGVVAPFSLFQELFVYSQTAYGWFCAQFALLAYLVLRMRDEDPREAASLVRPVGWTTALYALVLANLAVDSPLRAAVYWVAPMVAVVVALRLSRVRAQTLAVSTLVAFLAGVMTHFAISRYVLAQAGTTTQLKPISEWGVSFATVMRGLPFLIGYAQEWRALLTDGLNAVRLCFFALAALLVLFAPAGDGPGSVECRLFARVSSAMLLTVLAVLIVSGLALDVTAERYLVPPALLCITALMAILWCRVRASACGILAIAALFMLAFCGGAVVLLSRGTLAFERGCDAPENICRLEAALAKTGVHKGYATYWKSNVITVASHGAIETCGLALTQKQIMPFRWLVSRRCFDAPSEESYFIAFDQAEITKAGRAFLSAQAGTPDQVVVESEYEIWIYATAKANLDWLRR